MLQIGRSLIQFQMVLLQFFIDTILPIALWPWSRLSLSQKWVPGEFPGEVNAAGAYGWQPYHLPVPLPWNLGNLTSWNPLVHSRPGTELLYLVLLEYDDIRIVFWASTHPHLILFLFCYVIVMHPCLNVCSRIRDDLVVGPTLLRLHDNELN